MDRHRHSAVLGEKVTLYYGKENVLNGLDITVNKGSIYGLLGPSGCGKTTLLRCIVGLNKPTSGTIHVYGKSPGTKGCGVPGISVGYMPQELALYPEITIPETLTYFGRLYHMGSDDIKERIAFLTQLLDIEDKKKLIKQLSGGQQRRVSFAAALLHKPPLLILDEPTVGVDPLLRKSIWSHLQELAKIEFVSILITTHYIEESKQADVVGLLRGGRLLAEANPITLMEKYQVGTLEDVFLNLCMQNNLSVTIPRPKLHAHEKYLPKLQLPFRSESLKISNTLSESRPEDTADPRTFMPSSLGNPKGGCSAAMSRLAAGTTKNFLRLRRNIPYLFFQIVIPAVQAITFLVSMGRDPYDLTLSVVNLETHPTGYSHDFLKHIDPEFITQKEFANISLAYESVRRRESWGVLYIGPNFTDALQMRYLEGIGAENETIEDSTISLFLDMTNQQISMTIYRKVGKAFETFSKEAVSKFGLNPLVATSPLELGKPIYGDLELTFTEFMAPGMVLGIAYLMAMTLSTMSIIVEKKDGLMDRSLVAGVRSWEVVFSILIPQFLVMLLQVVVILLFTFKVFSLNSRGPFVWIAVAVLIMGLAGLIFGLLISSIVSDENSAAMLSMGSFYPSFLLSGLFWPLEAMPLGIRYFSYCLPITLIADSMRSILSRGWTITDSNVWLGYAVGLAWTFPVVIIASLFFKYKK